MSPSSTVRTIAKTMDEPRNPAPEAPAPLNPLRQEIDQIDTELVRLLDRRAEIARMVGRSKADRGVHTFDPGRAKAVLAQAVARSTGEFPREGLHYVFREILSACLNLQKPLRVGFLGPNATYAHQAAVREFGSSVDFVPYDMISEVFSAVENGWVDYGVVPVENSTGGVIHETLDSFMEHEAQICSETLLPIHHSLLATCSIGDVKRIYSHPQPFIQCAIWLRETLPRCEHIEVGSTVKGMLEAQKDPQGAAIGSVIGAAEYGLEVLARGIEDNPDNTTRFLVISVKDTPRSGDDKTSILFSMRDQPGVLFNLLKPFAEAGINLTKIESRPTRKQAWACAFFIDAVGHRTDAKLQEVVRTASAMAESVRILGSYPRERTPADIEMLRLGK